MLSFDIRSLEERAATVDGRLEATDPIWNEEDPSLARPIRATGRLSQAGAGRFYWSGRIKGAASSACRRCLAPIEVPVAEDVHLIFVEADDDEAEDSDVFRLPARAREVDLRPAIREQWLLAVPAYALCREDCKGLCPRCGADLNQGPCGCEREEADPRWAALRAVRADASESSD